MKIDEELAQLAPQGESVLTIGVLDGVHRGHRRLITHLTREAADAGRLAGVLTFRNHPASVLRPDFKPQYLSDLGERVRLIRELGVDFVFPITFDLELSKLGPRDFLLKLQRRARMSGLVVGPDFALGHGREGDVRALSVLGEEMGFSVGVVDLLVEGGEAIRSTVIRQSLARGDVGRVSEMLGRTFALAGVVVKGSGRGHSLGFPTANLQVPPEMAVPGDGIYATWARLRDRCYMAATSIGTRPTFDETERTVEAFILDFDGDIYEQKIRLEFVQRLRDEIRYDTPEALQEQVARDVEQTRTILGSGGAAS